MTGSGGSGASSGVADISLFEDLVDSGGNGRLVSAAFLSGVDGAASVFLAEENIEEVCVGAPKILLVPPGAGLLPKMLPVDVGLPKILLGAGEELGVVDCPKVPNGFFFSEAGVASGLANIDFGASSGFLDPKSDVVPEPNKPVLLLEPANGLGLSAAAGGEGFACSDGAPNGLGLSP